MQSSETISSLSTALAKCQGSMVAVKKESTNPFFKSKYASLDSIWDALRKPLSTNELSVTQTLGIVDGVTVLETTLMHSSGEFVRGEMPLNPVKDDPQGLGSAISYARRYSLSAILGVVSDEDDDGNAASPKQSKPQQAAQQSKPIPTAAQPEQPATGGITAPQNRKIQATCKELNIDKDSYHAYLTAAFDKGHTNELTKAEASEVIEAISEGQDRIDAELQQMMED